MTPNHALLRMRGNVAGEFGCHLVAHRRANRCAQRPSRANDGRTPQPLPGLCRHPPLNTRNRSRVAWLSSAPLRSLLRGAPVRTTIHLCLQARPGTGRLYASGMQVRRRGKATTGSKGRSDCKAMRNAVSQPGHNHALLKTRLLARGVAALKLEASKCSRGFRRRVAELCVLRLIQTEHVFRVRIQGAHERREVFEAGESSSTLEVRYVHCAQSRLARQLGLRHLGEELPCLFEASGESPTKSRRTRALHLNCGPLRFGCLGFLHGFVSVGCAVSPAAGELGSVCEAPGTAHRPPQTIL